MTSFDQIVEHFGPTARGIRKLMKGFTEQEIQAVMKKQGVNRLPKLYRELLLMAGHKGGHLLHPGKADEDLYFDLIAAKGSIEMMMASDDTTRPSLPDDAFVFVDDASLFYLFFLTDNEEDDPPVYRYLPDEEAPRIAWPSLSVFFIDEIDRGEKLQEKLKHERNKRRVSLRTLLRHLIPGEKPD